MASLLRFRLLLEAKPRWVYSTNMITELSEMYRGEKKSLQILLSSTQAEPGRKVKQGQEEISHNHVPRLFLGSVLGPAIGFRYTPEW